MDDLTIRRADRADRDALLGLAQELGTSFVVAAEAFDRSLDAALADDGGVVLVADQGGGMIGYLLASVHPTFFANGPVAWIEELMVDPGARRHGVGRAMVSACEAWARDRGVVMVTMATRRAGDFWIAVGYEPSATYHRKLLAD